MQLVQPATKPACPETLPVQVHTAWGLQCIGNCTSARDYHLCLLCFDAHGFGHSEMDSPLGCTQMEKDMAQQALKERLERLAPTGEPAMVFTASMQRVNCPSATCRVSAVCWSCQACRA